MKDLKILREKLGLTQRELAGYFGINRSCLAMAETGKRQIDSKTLIKIANVENFLQQKRK